MIDLLALGAICDNIADWNGDNKTRALSLSQDEITVAILSDCDRVAGQITEIRAMIAAALEPRDG